MSYFHRNLRLAGSLTMLALALILTGNAQAQQNHTDKTIQTIERNPVDNTPISITFVPGTNWKEEQAQEIFKKYLGNDGVENAFVLSNSTTTKMGITTNRYSQYYKGVKAEYGNYVLAIKEGTVKFIDGNYYNFNSHPSALPSVPESAAFNAALQYVGAEKYMWQNPGEEARIKAMYHKPDTTFLPHGILAWIEDYNSNNDDRVPHLAWSFDIYASKPLSRQKVFIDAITGKVIYSNLLTKHTAAVGHSRYSGAVPMVTSRVAGTYELYDSTRGNGVHTLNMNNGVDYSVATEFTSIANTWPVAVADSIALDAHWGGEKVYDYWKLVQGRLSWDNLDGILLQYVHCDVGFDNAFWDGAEMTYGDGSGCSTGFTPLTSLDVTAHEIGHGVCEATCNLIYQKEPGALNEGLSDCWGATIENYANPFETDAVAKNTWFMGEEIGCGNPLRRMDFPKLKGDPDTYNGTNYINTTSCTPTGGNDYCGVHTNSGVLNKWYYLVTVGGSGTNDVGNAYSVSGLTFTKSQNILYQTELILPSNATFAVMRTSSINTASTLYGPCSNEVVQVTNAWYAVNVGAAYVSPVTPITGVASVCVGNTTTLANVTGGGTWFTANSAIASIGSGSGVVTGVSAGTVVISYTIATGCSAYRTVTVNPLPFSISGASSVCQGANTTLTDPTVSGTWSSSTTAVATIGSLTGIVTGVTPGTSLISYTLTTTGCANNMVMTVNPPPAPITGAGTICAGSSVTLNDVTGTGTWSSSATGVAVISSSTGVLLGAGAGTATISYILGTGCFTTAVETVNNTPVGIAGSTSLCQGATTTLTDATPAGTWSSTNTAVATIVTGTGFLTAVSPGTAIISYTLATGCNATTVVTVNTVPGPITGSSIVCEGSSVTLGNSVPGGNWTSSNSAVATIGGTTGIAVGVSPGTATIVYTLAGGCSTSIVETVNVTPVAITGTPQLCVTMTTTLSNSTPGGNWTSGNTAIATAGALTGVISGITAGTATILYTLGSGCQAAVVVTVNSLPTAIVGSSNICTGTLTSYTDGVTGGTWSSNNTAIATIGLSSGLASALTAGGTILTYTLGAGCYVTKPVTVDNSPAAITGPSSVCQSASITLSDATATGTWSSSLTSIASIISTSGVLTGVTGGTTTVSYILPTGCFATTVITVNLPSVSAITGSTNSCVGQTNTLTDITPGGTWSSSNPAMATIGLSSGIVTGISTGSAIITYSAVTPCGPATAYMTITINPAPSVAVITGTSSSVCTGATISLNDATPGGAWSSANNAIAMVDISGNVTGVTAGIVPISYTVTNTVGCSSSAVVNITVTTPVNSVITPMSATTFCTGGSVLLTGPAGTGYGYQWQVGGVNISGATTSSYFATTGGNYTLVLNSGSGCLSTSSMVTITVNPAPIVAPTVSITASPGNILCVVPSPVTFTATSVNGGTSPSYDWFVNGAYVGTGVNYNYTPASGDVVRCRLTSNYICAVPDTATASMTMTISPLMSPSVAIRTDPGQIVCKGNSVSFTAVPTYGGSAPIYLWTLNGINVATGPIYILYTPATGDVIKCYMTSNYPCLVTNSAASSPVRIIVENPSVNTITMHVTQMSTLAGRPDTFSVTAPNGGSAPRYQWYVNGGAVPGATNSVWIVSTLNNGDVVNCSVTSSDPCASPATAFSGGVTMNIGVNGVMNINSNTNFTLAPNPNKGEFTITGNLTNSADDRVFVKIVDILGQTIYSSTIHANSGLVNEHIVLPTSIANGMYLVNITSGENKEVYHVSVDR